MESRLADISSAFDLPGPPRSAVPLGAGRIHETWLAEVAGPEETFRVVLQRMNERVLPDPEAVMANLASVLDHAKRRGSRLLPRLIPARDGRTWIRDPSGGAWRAFHYEEGTVTREAVEDPVAAREAGAAFGRFACLCRDLDPTCLVKTLPGFHDTPRRLRQLEEVAGRHPDRAAEVGEEIEALLGRAPEAGALIEALRSGAIPSGVCHNDAKLGNLLFDVETGRAVRVIDLDTVMPGTVLFDFGDLVRSVLNQKEEGPRPPETVRFRSELFRAVAEGWLRQVGPLLGDREIELLFPACRLIPLELASRFLADHLRGDHYFRVSRPGENLERARVQLALANRIEEHREEIEAVVRKVLGR